MVMSVLSRTQVFEWFKRFEEGREEIGDDQSLGSSQHIKKTDANIENVGETVRQNHRPEHSSIC